MKFDSYIPCEVLRPYIKALVISESEAGNIYKVIPETGLVMGFQYKGGLSYVRDAAEIQLTTSGITGMNDSYRMFKSLPTTGTVLVYFREGYATAFFDQPVHEFFRESLSIDNMMLRSTLLILEEQLWAAKTDIERVSYVEAFLKTQLRRFIPDHLVLQAIALICRRKGNIRIKELMNELHISQSPLEKRFRSIVGATPKKFASIVRLRHAIQSYDAQQPLTDLGYQAGFYDQAHFIKEFKAFTGTSPEVFFKRKDQ
ncbi:helix-turn-helix domain-containing protein [Pedobacter sp. JY14-1]|uniref:helix-turn-helix domain-containing protein n=1 Tax=Pedobacter sp. JY14-1 TaxID=3034151 RepID=UPI0023E12363|nr:helix-turn-helix domain-containing protein [Pedobacter sp. JY14-1]